MQECGLRGDITIMLRSNKEENFKGVYWVSVENLSMEEITGDSVKVLH